MAQIQISHLPFISMTSALPHQPWFHHEAKNMNINLMPLFQEVNAVI